MSDIIDNKPPPAPNPDKAATIEAGVTSRRRGGGPWVAAIAGGIGGLLASVVVETAGQSLTLGPRLILLGIIAGSITWLGLQFWDRIRR